MTVTVRRHQIREKVFSFGDHFQIKDEFGRDVFTVRSKNFLLGNKVALEDMVGNGLLKIHQELLHFHPTLNILSARDSDSDRPLATIKKKFSFFCQKFDIQSVDGQYAIEGLDIFAHSFVLTKQGQAVATISKAFFSLTDTSGVEIAANEDQTFILALVIVIDQVLRQVFIGNLCNVSNEALRTYCETYGPLTELSLNRDKENNVYHCFAFVTFQYTRSTSQFMSSRPHFICDEEIFVKRALPRATSSVPERIIVTNRLILQDLHKYDKHLVRNYFHKFGYIKKIDIKYGFIDYEDYDAVDRVLIARPHYIRDQEIFVTKFVPSEQQDSIDNYYLRSNNYRHHRLNTNNNRRYSNKSEQHDHIMKTSTDTIKFTCTKKIEKDTSEIALINKQCNHDDNDDDDDEEEGGGGEEINFNQLNIQYEHLEEEFEEYKKTKEIEICALRIDLERTKRQLADITQEKLDILLKNQTLFHNELILRLSSNDTAIHSQTAEDFFHSSPNQLTKKRKLATSPPSSAHREYEYYS
ncbi:unnamed protein product [Rotaria sp. Silwood1]|nr:unnamed protein product [Rotaria sp. Silwood1]CAF1506438.1 unnamed protein product [Rotaria sp. Silwood1]